MWFADQASKTNMMILGVSSKNSLIGLMIGRTSNDEKASEDIFRKSRREILFISFINFFIGGFEKRQPQSQVFLMAHKYKRKLEAALQLQEVFSGKQQLYPTKKT